MISASSLCKTAASLVVASVLLFAPAILSAQPQPRVTIDALVGYSFGCGQYSGLGALVTYTIDCDGAPVTIEGPGIARSDACLAGPGTFTEARAALVSGPFPFPLVHVASVGFREGLDGTGRLLARASAAYNCLTGETVECPLAPRTGCRQARRSSLLVRNSDDDARDALDWKWLRGASISLADFGEEPARGSQQWCAYAGATQDLEVGATAAQRGLTIYDRAWNERGTSGLRYVDKDLSAFGLHRINVRGGPDGRSRIVLRGAGVTLPDPQLPLELPVTVQYTSLETGVCFEATYTAEDVKENSSRRFKAVDGTR